ncbi:MAG: response regulator [Rhodothermaceae bacterium]|nr:response regulator [Rhodothermaceae bacterium]
MPLPLIRLRYVFLKLWLLAGILWSPVHAQQVPKFDVHPDYTYRQFTIQDGLPSNTINTIYQTHDGYLWLGTNEGLVRFDGYTFTTFNATNSPGLASNRIASLEESPDGHLWIASDLGELTLYHEGTFTRLDFPVNASHHRPWIFATNDTVMIKGQEGLMIYANDHMELYYPELFDATVSAVQRDSKGRLWVGIESKGIYRLSPHYDPETNKNSVKFFDLGFAGDLFIDSQERVWYEGNGGVFRIENDSIELIHDKRDHAPFRIEFEDEEGNIWITQPEKGWWQHSLSGTKILFPLPDSSLAIQDSSLAKRIKQSPHGEPWRFFNQQKEGAVSEDILLQHNQALFKARDGITEFYFDPNGNIWVGTQRSGLIRLRSAFLQTLEGLPPWAVYPILQDRVGHMWIGTFGDGFVRFDASENLTQFLPKKGNASVHVLSLFEHSNGSLWVSGIGFLCQVKEDQCINMDIPAIELFNIRAMHEDQKGHFWLGGELGLLVSNGRETTQSWQHVKSRQGFPQSWVRVIKHTSNGSTLFGTNGDGLLQLSEPLEANAFIEPDGLDAVDDTIYVTFDILSREQGLPSNFVRDVYEDEEGYLWIALEDQGLCRLDRRGQVSLTNGDLRCMDSRNGLYQSGLHRILEDDFGRFWFNTNNGIFWVKRSMLNEYLDGQIPAVTSVSYTEAEGMHEREGNGGIQPAGIKASDGRLWFPTQEGVVIVDPFEVPLPEAPPVILEEILVGDKIQYAAQSVTLSPKERDVSIRYSALEFTRADDVRFQYYLEGYEGTWKDGGKERLAGYTNLPPNSYTFHVRAGIGGVWSNPVSLDIERLPFFWQTWWFYSLAAVFLIFSGSSVYLFRVKQLKAREATLERIVTERTAELKQANELKSRFLANISHEFRTPLTLTFGPLEDALSGRFSTLDEALPSFERARRNGNRLLRLINQLLDLSKIDAGALLLRPNRSDLTQHLRQITALFDSFAESKNIHFAKQIPGDSLSYVYDVDKIEKVVVNLLSNAFKFTPPGGKVSVSFSSANGGIEIIVADTGAGISREHLPHLFDRFYQAESTSTRSHEGTGIGLALAKELVELHDGTIRVESTEGFGSRFTVQLPESPKSEVQGPEPEVVERAPKPVLATTVLDELPTPTTSINSRPRTPDSGPLPVILVIEDNPDMRAYISTHMGNDFELIEAENGRIGVEKAIESVPDLVLSDVMMPEMDGIEACSAIKADERTSHIPVILLTARAQVEDRIAGFESGADAYLAKPFNAEELLVRVNGLIEQRRKLRERFRGMKFEIHSERMAKLPEFYLSVSGDGSQIKPSSPPPEPVFHPREAAFLQRVRSLIQDQLDDTQFGVHRLAEELAMSRRQLHRKLSSLTNETPAALIRQVRLSKAASLLMEGTLSVKEVCYAVGFQSESSFGRTFRQEFGVVPSEYRASKIS